MHLVMRPRTRARAPQRDTRMTALSRHSPRGAGVEIRIAAADASAPAALSSNAGGMPPSTVVQRRALVRQRPELREKRMVRAVHREKPAPGTGPRRRGQPCAAPGTTRAPHSARWHRRWRGIPRWRARDARVKARGCGKTRARARRSRSGQPAHRETRRLLEPAIGWLSRSAEEPLAVPVSILLCPPTPCFMRFYPPGVR
jgi:hypothetical protein